jgi:hypothetical protein
VLPALRLSWATDSTHEIARLGSTVLALGDGSIIIALPPDSAQALVRLSPDGTALPLGRRGSGPGELRGAIPVDESDGTIDVFDMMQLRLHRFQADGSVQDIVVTSPFLPRAPAIRGGRPVLVGAAPGPGGSLPAVMDLGDGTIEKLLTEPDSFMVEHFGPTGVGIPRSPVIGLWANGFLIGDGNDYALALYDWDGELVRVLSRDLPRLMRTPAQIDRSLADLVGRSPAQKERTRVELESTPLPHFSHTTATGIDALNRVWVLGPAGDSAYADVFSDHRFLGRLAVPCHDFSGSWSLNARWLSLICTDPSSPDDLPQAQVYQVIDPTG